MDLKISEINVLPFKNQGGFCGFASCVINNQFYVGNIAIYTSPVRIFLISYQPRSQFVTTPDHNSLPA